MCESILQLHLAALPEETSPEKIAVIRSEIPSSDRFFPTHESALLRKSAPRLPLQPRQPRPASLLACASIKCSADGDIEQELAPGRKSKGFRKPRRTAVITGALIVDRRSPGIHKYRWKEREGIVNGPRGALSIGGDRGSGRLSPTPSRRFCFSYFFPFVNSPIIWSGFQCSMTADLLLRA
jgi:hypothetical protein